MTTTEMREMTVPFQYREEADDDNIFRYSGIAATHDFVDSAGNRIQRGAFDESLKEMKKRGALLPALWQHLRHEPIGVYKEIRETKEGLFVRAELPREDTFVNGRVIPQLRMGSISRMSIGWLPHVWTYNEEESVRDITEAQLMEVSLVTFPADDHAGILEMRAAVSYQDLPLADRDRPWNSSAALRLVRAWAGVEGSEDLESRSVRQKFRRAFLWYDREKEETLGAYKLPIATVEDGRLTAVPRGIFAAAAAMRGARGGVAIPQADRAGVIRHLERYYSKMGMDSPFERQAFRLDDFGSLDERTLEKLLRTGVSFSARQSKRLISGLKSAGLRDAADGHRDGDKEPDSDFSMLNRKMDEILINLRS